MKNRPALVILAFLVLAAGLAGTWYCFRPHDRITQANCDRISAEMTEQDVNDLLGQEGTLMLFVVSGNWGYAHVEYRGEGGRITVEFGGPDGLVRGASFTPIDKPPLLDRLRAWLGL
jgi:hypothetical protein